MSKLCYYRFEQLVRLGLPGQLFIPALLRELHRHIPSISNTFCWQNTHDNLNNIYDEMSNTKVIKQFVLAMASTETDKYSHAVEWISSLDKPVTSFEPYGMSPHLAEFYKTVLLPLGYFNSCFVPIIQAETKTRLGVLMVHRKRRAPEFTQKERNFLDNIASIIAYGLSRPVLAIKYTADGWERGLLISDQKGIIQYACLQGEKLLTLASASQFNADSTLAINDLTVFKNLDLFIKELLSSSKHNANYDNPTLTTNNAWGKFILRGFVIKDKAGIRTQQIGFNIHWQEPFVLKLFHRIRNLKLTPRQETIGLLYAAGDAQRIIAGKLNLSLYTVKEHIKNLCGRLKTRSRSELIEHILCD